MRFFNQDCKLENERARYGLAGSEAQLAYRFDRPGYTATFQLDRIDPRVTARTISFVQVGRDGLKGHYELEYEGIMKLFRGYGKWLTITCASFMAVRTASISVEMREISLALRTAVSARRGASSADDSSLETVTGLPVFAITISRASRSCAGLRTANCDAIATASTRSNTSR